jgi:hypothetical protein
MSYKVKNKQIIAQIAGNPGMYFVRVWSPFPVMVF